ncbi:MAG: sodium:solute symporter family protein, partial [Synergistaceae bacterium]|nr:sodium:solute symporter family protein [Synergistaceae bacterium]
LVGGASTVGTVQMAYTYGLTAWWFTLGGGIACLLIALRFAKPLRDSGITTIADFLAQNYGGEGSFYGDAISTTVSVSSSLGTLLSICAQFLSCTAMLRGIFPISVSAASLVSALSILGFIAAGGLKSYSKLGQAKIVLLFFILISCCAAAFNGGGSIGAVTSELPFHSWFNIFGRGFVPEMGHFASMVVGVFTTQIYIQSLAAAKDAETARKGALVSAFLMPLMGLLGTWIGLTVRARGVDIAPEKALSWFIMDSFSPAVAGLIWGGILITVIGCAAGLVLGISTNISKNLVPRRVKAHIAGHETAFERWLVLVIVAAAAVSGMFSGGSMILEWSYMSMGLRGAGAFFPFIAAILRPGLLDPLWALAASIGGLVGMLAWKFAGFSGDPLFAGLVVSALCVLIGIIFNGKK